MSFSLTDVRIWQLVASGCILLLLLLAFLLLRREQRQFPHRGGVLAAIYIFMLVSVVAAVLVAVPGFLPQPQVPDSKQTRVLPGLALDTTYDDSGVWVTVNIRANGPGSGEIFARILNVVGAERTVPFGPLEFGQNNSWAQAEFYVEPGGHWYLRPDPSARVNAANLQMTAIVWGPVDRPAPLKTR